MMKSSAVASWAAAGALAVLVVLVATDHAPKVQLPAAASVPAASATPTPASKGPSEVPASTNASSAKPMEAANSSTPPATPPPAPDSSNGVILRFVSNPEPVPGFQLASFSGQKLYPAEWRGKVVILNFWATWCGPCRYEIPELVRLQKEFQGSLQVVGLSVDEAPPAEVKTFIDHFDVNYPVAIASEKLQDEFGGILALPTSFVINRDGRVVQKHVGLVPEDYYATEIAYLAGKPTNARVESFKDVGQVFPSNAKYATSLPGVDMSRLSPAQRKLALKEMNEEHCNCGCDYTIAQCRLLDSACPVSAKEAQAIVNRILAGKPPKKSAGSTASMR